MNHPTKEQITRSKPTAPKFVAVITVHQSREMNTNSPKKVSTNSTKIGFCLSNTTSFEPEATRKQNTRKKGTQQRKKGGTLTFFECRSVCIIAQLWKLKKESSSFFEESDHTQLIITPNSPRPAQKPDRIAEQISRICPSETCP